MTTPSLRQYIAITITCLILGLFAQMLSQTALASYIPQHKHVKPQNQSLGAIRSLSSNIPNPDSQWFTYRTEHFDFHYEEGYTKHVEEYARIAETIYSTLSAWAEVEITGTGPTEKIQVVLNDSADYSNAFTRPSPYDRVEIYLTPPSNGQLLDNGDWIELVLTHELTHAFHMAMVDGIWPFIRTIVGNHPLTYPNWASPYWLLEGIAVYKESENKYGYGRGNTGIYEDLMRKEVATDIMSLMETTYITKSKTFPKNKHYYYGYFFFEFLQQKYGSDKVTQYVKELRDNLIPYSLNEQAKSTTGKSLFNLWREYQGWLEKRFQPQIANYKKSKSAKPKIIQGQQGRHLSAVADHKGGYYFIFDDLYEAHHVYYSKNGATEKITKARHAKMLDYHPKTGLIATQLGVCDNRKYYYDLYRYNVEEDEWQRLTECARIKDFKISPDGKHIIASNNLPSGQQLLLLNSAGKTLKTLNAGKFGNIIGRGAWRSNNQVVVPEKARFTSWNLFSYQLNFSGKTPKTTNKSQLTDDNIIYTSPLFDSQNNLYAITNHDKKWRVRKFIDNKWQDIHASLGPVYSASYFKDNKLLLVQETYDSEAITELEIKPNSAQNNHSKVADNNKLSRLFKPHKLTGELTHSKYSLYDHTHSYMSSFGYEAGTAFPINRAFLQYSGVDVLNNFQYVLKPTLYKFAHHDDWDIGGVAVFSYADKYSLSLLRDLQPVIEDTQNNLIYTKDIDVKFTYYRPIYSRKTNHKLLASINLGAQEYNRILDQQQSALSDVKNHALQVGWQFDSSESAKRSIAYQDGSKLSAILTGYNQLLLNPDREGNIFRFDYSRHFHLGYSNVLEIASNQGIRSDRQTSTSAKYRFYLGGNDIDQPLSITQTSIPLPGYKTGELSGDVFHYAKLQWDFPIFWYPFGLVIPPIDFDRLSGALAFQAANTWWQNGNSTTREDKYLKAVTLSFKTDFAVLLHYPIRFKISMSQGLDDGGEYQFNFATIINFTEE